MRPHSPIIPAILTSNKTDFVKQLAFAQSAANTAHIDVIDGEFCQGLTVPIKDWPNIDCGYSEAHLMVREPLPYLAQLHQKNITRAIIHIESNFDLNELRQTARSLDILLGFAINPDTDLERLRPVLEVSNYIQVMGVYPGTSGQMEIKLTPLAVSYLKTMPSRRLVVTVDGGVDRETIPLLLPAGPDYLVAASAIFNRTDWTENYEGLINLMTLKAGS